MLWWSVVQFCQTGQKSFGHNLYQSNKGLGSKQQIAVEQNTKEISLEKLQLMTTQLEFSFNTKNIKNQAT
jgi:hypothetical protein